jgi:predicted phosphodiesterase
VTFTWGWTSNPAGGFWNKLNNVRPLDAQSGGEPLWPVIQPAAPVVVAGISPIPRPSSRWKTAVLMADTQIGFRRYEDGTLDPFHDDAAMDVALQIVALENPDRTVVMGDILDLSEQGKFAQEAAFANTTQAALDRTHLFGAQMRAATDGLVDWIEGNHDKRMQNFIEANAKAAFGLRQANMPDSWPVMSIPNLLRLAELDITYRDAYPVAHVWINDYLRAEHGTKVNSNGSTAQKYMNETPHISRAFGHTHRLEALSRTTYDRQGKLRSMAINPGCLCRVDGAVPSVHGAIGAGGRPATVYEDWQNGVAVIRYTDDEFFVDLVQIEDGHTVYMGQEINATR